MKHKRARAHNRKVIHRVGELVEQRSHRPWRIPSYKAVVGVLNREGCTTSRGNAWTPHRLFRMLQRQGISGLHGIRYRYYPARSGPPDL